MTTLEAKRILLLYRPKSGPPEPEMEEALQLAREEPEVREWFKNHRAIQEGVSARLRSIEPPAGLKERLLAAPKIAVAPWWQQPVVWASALAAMLMGGLLLSLALRPTNLNRLDNFQARMVGTALREYRMDVVTNDMTQLRQFISAKGAPGDYSVPAALANLQLTGGGVLKWRSNPVSMVCFNRGDSRMLFLFVVRRDAITDPPLVPQHAKLTDLVAVSWSAGDYTYLLAGPGDSDLRKYL